MPRPTSRIVQRRADGLWENFLFGNTRATSVHSTQSEAREAAFHDLSKHGGGELLVRGRNGQIRAKDTVPPAQDPRRSRG
ncbi:MAG: DUF2188 domain-containing protein [Casimicrobiaceae bacterium]|nr:DUF2188 domain-containing protein [Casimicrobiaceae bacterium]